MSELICKELEHIAYFDKDDLQDLLRCSFSVSGEKMDMDGDFYLKNLRSAEYNTLLQMAFSALRFEKLALVNAPFLKEVRDVDYMRNLKERANLIGAELFLIWVSAPVDVCYERMKARNSDRDILKLKEWEQYVKKTDYSVPTILEQKGAINTLIVFNNENEATMYESMRRTLKILRS